MKKVFTVLRQLFGSKPSTETRLQWAKTEYGRDWRWAYEHLVATRGQSPKDIGK